MVVTLLLSLGALALGAIVVAYAIPIGRTFRAEHPPSGPDYTPPGHERPSADVADAHEEQPQAPV